MDSRPIAGGEEGILAVEVLCGFFLEDHYLVDLPRMEELGAE